MRLVEFESTWFLEIIIVVVVVVVLILFVVASCVFHGDHVILGRHGFQHPRCGRPWGSTPGARSGVDAPGAPGGRTPGAAATRTRPPWACSMLEVLKIF